jgi:histidine triad (HIT) family protein
MGEDCIFCRIVGGETPASVISRGSKVMAFMDAYPVNQGHVLVIPLDHAPHLADLDPEAGGEIFKLAMEVSQAIRETEIKCEGVNLILADGEKAGQEVFHVHLHVIPRYSEDNFSMSSRTREAPSRDELDSLAEGISGLL